MFETKIKKIVLASTLTLAAGACAVPSESESDTQEKTEKTSDETNETPEEQTSDVTTSDSAENKATVADAPSECLGLPSDPVACRDGEGVEASQADEDDSNELTGYTDNREVIDTIIEETDGYVTLRTSSINFRTGESTATASDAVVRATANVHIFNVDKAGQNIKIDISSIENNAWFRVVTPSGKVYGDVSVEGLTEFDEESTAGDYAIIVTSQRGNASYDLTLEIE